MHKMSLPEALWIVCQNAQGVKHNYWNEYLPAILMVNEHKPHEGHTIEEGEGEHELDIVAYWQERNARYDWKHQG